MLANTIHSIMTTEVVFLPLDATLKDTVSLMSQKNISCVVIEENQKPLGIITERDILKIAAQDKNVNRTTKDLNYIKVKDVMSSPVKTVSKNMDVYEAAMYMDRHNFRRIIIVDEENKVAGLVTQTDLRNHLGAIYYLKLKTIASIMTKEVITAEHNKPLLALIQKMNNHNIGCLVIIKDNKPIGIITERDVTRLMANKENPFNQLAEDLASFPLVFISQDTSIFEAVKLMQKKNIRRLVVVGEEKQVIGLVAESDIIKKLEINYLDFLRSIVERDRVYINAIEEGLFECTLGVNGIFTWINQYGAKVLGYSSPEKIIGNLKLKDIFVNPNELEGLMTIINKEGTIDNYSTKLKKHHGKNFYAECTFCLIKNGAKKITFLEGIIKDVTTRKKMQDKLARYSAKLETEVRERTAVIVRKNRELEEANAKLHEMAIQDGLTGLKNFRYLSHILEIEFKKAIRHTLPLSCIILDIDDFKFINDRFGHLNGDFALKKTAQLLEKLVRDTDIVARYGGDEFTIVLPNTDLKGASSVGNKILERFRAYKLNQGELKLGEISLSLGISALPDASVKTAGQLLEYADKAMYRAKESGKNNVYTYLELA